jgi:hypothetical protein
MAIARPHPLLSPLRLRTRNHVVAFSVLSTLLALGAMFAVAEIAGLERVEHILVRPDLRWLAVGAGALVLVYAGYTVAYREIACAADGDRLSLRQAGALVSSGFGLFVPAGGFAVDVAALERMNVPRREARVRVLGLGALEYAVLAPAACIAAVALVVRGAPVDTGVTWPWMLAVPAGAAVAGWFFVRRARMRGRSAWRRALCAAMDALGVLTGLWHQRGRLLLAGAGMAAYWAGDMLLLWAALHVFLGRAPSLPALIVGYATGYALTRRTLPLAGAGVVDFCLPFALSWASIPLAAALVSVFAYRVFNLWLPLAPALVGWRHVVGDG